MDLGNAVDTAKKIVGKPLSDILFDRLRNNFYGYILTSLILFNLENIILVLKSKDSIELTLIYIGLQKSFPWNFFWKPIIWGMGAAIFMPITTASYALIVGVINAIREDSGTVGADLWETFKKSAQAKREAARLEKNKIEEKSARLTSDCQKLENRLEELQKRREELEEYLLKLVHMYRTYHHSKSQNRNLAGFIATIPIDDISSHFPSLGLLKEMKAFFENEIIETENSEEDLGTGANGSSEIHADSKQSN